MDGLTEQPFPELAAYPEDLTASFREEGYMALPMLRASFRHQSRSKVTDNRGQTACLQQLQARWRGFWLLQP